jgi:hypothetical protein
MVWFRVDDRLPDHHKVRKAGTAAMGLWLLAGAWAAGNLTDGWVPLEVARRYGTKRQADRLEEAGLWVAGVRAGEPGWNFHDWTEHQPTREMVQKRRQNATERQTKWRKSQEQTTGHKPVSRVDKSVGHAVSHAAPDPTRTKKNTPTAVDHVTTDRASARNLAAALSSKGHTPAAHNLVETYADTRRKRPPATVRNELAVQVDALLAEDWTTTEIAQALAAWGDKGLDARKLPSVANEIANRAPDRGQTPRPNATDAFAAQFLNGGNHHQPELRALPGGAS